MRFNGRSHLLGDYQFGLRVFGNELKQAAVGRTTRRVLNPCVEELGDEF